MLFLHVKAYMPHGLYRIGTRYRYFYFTNQTDVKGEKTAIFALTRFVKKTGSLFYELRSRLFLFLLILKKHSSCKASSHTYPLRLLTEIQNLNRMIDKKLSPLRL